jgi:hypothetical protein
VHRAFTRPARPPVARPPSASRHTGACPVRLLLSQKTAPLQKQRHFMASQWYNMRGPDGSRQTPRWSSQADRRPRTPTYHACSVRRVSRESSLSDANFGLRPPQSWVGLPAVWPIAPGALAGLGRGSRMWERRAGHCVSRQASENRGETRFRPRRPGDPARPQGPCGTGPFRRADPWRAPFAGLGISPASYCRSASCAPNMRISQKPEVSVSVPRTFTPPGGRDRAEEGRRE